MNRVTIALSSPSSAIKVKSLFTRAGITTKIIKLDGGRNGCTHAVEIDEADLLNAISLLRANEVRYSVQNGK